MTVVAELRRASVRLGQGDAQVPALTWIDLQIAQGEIVGVVGEAGAGKSTLARALLRLVAIEDGAVLLEGEDISTLPERRLRRLRGRMTMVFRNPLAVLNPRMTVRALLEEPLRLHTKMTAAERRTVVDALAERLRLRPGEVALRPADLSIDRLQLVSLGRAIVTRPALLVLDEPTREMDMAAAAQFLSLLAELRDASDMAIVLISHDIAAVQPVADRIAVLYLGEIVEEGSTADLLRDALHPYTQALLSASPTLDPALQRKVIPIQGELPSPLAPPNGCAFHPRCPQVVPRCREEAPQLRDVGGQRVACHLV